MYNNVETITGWLVREDSQHFAQWIFHLDRKLGVIRAERLNTYGNKSLKMTRLPKNKVFRSNLFKGCIGRREAVDALQAQACTLDERYNISAITGWHSSKRQATAVLSHGRIVGTHLSKVPIS